MKPYEFSTTRADAATKPLTFEDLERLLEELRRPAPEKLPPTHDIDFAKVAEHDIDFAKVAEHGIRMGWDGRAERWMMSASEMARAEKVGAIMRKPVTA